jgi:hypothetical protein
LNWFNTGAIAVLNSAGEATVWLVEVLAGALLEALADELLDELLPHPVSNASASAAATVLPVKRTCIDPPLVASRACVRGSAPADAPDPAGGGPGPTLTAPPGLRQERRKSAATTDRRGA